MTKKARITPQSAKAKGRNLQNWAAQKISEVLNLPWGKDEMIASREASQSGTDIRLVGEAKERFPFSVECKWQEAWSVHAWIEQARDNQEEGTDWLVIAKRNRMNPVVIMDADRFFDLLRTIEQEDKGRLAQLLRSSANE